MSSTYFRAFYDQCRWSQGDRQEEYDAEIETEKSFINITPTSKWVEMTHVNMTPGATKSVNDGELVP